MKTISTRLPDELHGILAVEVARRKVDSPKFSVNDALIEAVKGWVLRTEKIEINRNVAQPAKQYSVKVETGEGIVVPPKSKKAMPDGLSTSDAARWMREHRA